MTAAYRMRGLGWFLTGVCVAITFLLVSLQVAVERKKVIDLNRAIATAKRDIRMLETEFNTRANLSQLEKWNGDVLALVAPRAEQFLDNSAALAQVDFNAPGAHVDKVRAVAYVVPALYPMPGVDIAVGESTNAGAPQAAGPATSGVSGAVAAVIAAAGAPGGVAQAHVGAPALAVRTGAPASANGAPRSPMVARAASVDMAATRRSATIALLDRKLLSDSTLDDLMSTARAEARRR